jgi:hypothetical protein
VLAESVVFAQIWPPTARALNEVVSTIGILFEEERAESVQTNRHVARMLNMVVRETHTGRGPGSAPGIRPQVEQFGFHAALPSVLA